MITNKELLKILEVEHGVVSNREPPTSFITTGIVVDTDDPLQAGRLRVFCPTLNDDPKKLHHLPWAVYMSPTGGSINNSQFSRGEGKGPEKTEGAVAYGFWSIPEQGAKVLVTCIDGDERRRVWMGCLHEHQETHTLFHGRYKWDGDGEPDGPLSSTDSPIEPAYTNAGKAFNGDRNSREWKTRNAEYQVSAIPKDGDPPNSSKPTYLDETFEQISQQETDEWVETIVGAHGYDWSGNKALGSHMASRVYGFSTPGFHAWSMDDRPFNSRIRFRTATGHHILLDDTNERIYVATNEGNNWIEMDSSGNIDIYAKRRISVHSEKDINFSTDETFRVKAKKGIYMYSGDTRDQEELEAEKPEDGEIRFHSTGDTHFMVEKNMRTLIKEDWLTEVGGKSCITVAEDFFLQVEKDINVITNNGDYNISINGNYNHNVTNTTSIFSGRDNKMQAVNDTEIFSFTGKADYGAMKNVTIKSIIGDLTLMAKSPKSNIKLTSNAGGNELSMRNPAFGIFSQGEFTFKSPKPMGIQINEGFGVTNGQPSLNGSPIGSGCLTLSGGVNIKFSPTAIEFDAPDDIKSKIKSGINAVATSINTINDNFNQIERKVNDLAYTAGSKLAEIVGVSDPFDILSITVPSLPSFPQIPTLSFPAIDLPDFDFDFCIDVDPFLTVDNFNLIPDNLFDVNVNLGILSKNDIKSWWSGQTGKFTNSIDRLGAAKNELLDFNTPFNKIKNSVDQMKNAVDNFVDINVNIDHTTTFTSYSGGAYDFRDALVEYNEYVDIHNSNPANTQLDNLVELANEIDKHSKGLQTLERRMETNGSEIDNADFTDLLDIKPIIDQYSTDLGDI